MRKTYQFMVAWLMIAVMLSLGAVTFAQSPYLIFSIGGYGDVVTGAKWNRSQTQIMSWAADGTIQVSDAATGTLLFTLTHTDGVVGAAWNQAETQILTWSADGTAQIWDAVTGENLFALPSNDALNGATWNSDETLIMTWADDGSVRIFSADDGDELAVIQQGDFVPGAAISADSTRILSFAADGTILISTFDGVQALPEVTMPNDTPVLGALWNPAQDRIISWAADNNNVTVWDAATGRQIALLSHAGQARGGVWSADGNRILTWSADGSARIWQSGAAPILMGHGAPVISAKFIGADDSQILTIAENGRLYVRDAVTGDQIQVFDQGEIQPTGAAVSHNGNLILTWADDGIARMWDIKSGLLIVTLDPGTLAGPVLGAIWNAQDSQILTWGADSMVHLWNAFAVPQF